MKRVFIVFVLLLVPPLSVLACLWDSDTLESEGRGMPEVVAVLTGRFERNPPLYYEMRLARVAAELESRPENLAAYDDAGVACDRLGRGGEAIAWMKRKHDALKKRGHANVQAIDSRERLEFMNHWYRYHANLGTFLVHDWARRGADRSRIDEVKAARDEIARALKINPEAHFGREKYELRALDWIIAPPEWRGRQYLPNLLGIESVSSMQVMLDPKTADAAVRGLSGLIVLGNAWESVDVFYALEAALEHDTLGFKNEYLGGRNTLAYLAWLRCRELIDAGKGSMLPGTPKGEELKKLLGRPDFISPNELLDPTFVKFRAEADAWQEARESFMLKRLKEGRHPDTDEDFWKGYKEKPAPRLPTKTVRQAFQEGLLMKQRIALAVFVAVPTLLVAGVFLVTRYLNKGRKPSAKALREV